MLFTPKDSFFFGISSLYNNKQYLLQPGLVIAAFIVCLATKSDHIAVGVKSTIARISHYTSSFADGPEVPLDNIL